MLDTKESKNNSTPLKKINSDKIDKLKTKTPIKCENGIAQIDSSHPDYKFWMED